MWFDFRFYILIVLITKGTLMYFNNDHESHLYLSLSAMTNIITNVH